MRTCLYLKKPMMKTVNELGGYEMLSGANTRCAKINTGKPVWWIEMPPELFERDLHLLLIKERGFIWLWIKAGSIPEPRQEFWIRPDKDFVQLEISSILNNLYLRDVKNRRRYNFRPHVAGEWDDD